LIHAWIDIQGRGWPEGGGFSADALQIGVSPIGNRACGVAFFSSTGEAALHVDRRVLSRGRSSLIPKMLGLAKIGLSLAGVVIDINVSSEKLG
jgi:hypothetical protein